MLDQYIEDTWEIEENFAGLLEVKDAVDGNNPVLHNDNPSDDGNCTELDRWFHEKFPTNLEELTANLNMLSYLKQMMNQLAETVEGMDGYTNVYLEDTDIKGDFLPSGGGMVNTDDRFNKNEPDYIHDENALETQLKNTGESAGELFKGLNFATLVTEGRDNLYATMYIMNMFSYETSALEGLYELQGGGKDETDIYKMAYERYRRIAEEITTLKEEQIEAKRKKKLADSYEQRVKDMDSFLEKQTCQIPEFDQL